MALFYLFSFSLFILLAHVRAHNVAVKWMPKPKGEGANVVFYGITIDGKVEQPLTITPGDKDNSPHFFIDDECKQRERKHTDRKCQSAFHRWLRRARETSSAADESGSITQYLAKNEEYLFIESRKDQDSRDVDFKLQVKGKEVAHGMVSLGALADDIAKGNVYYKSQTDTKFRRLGAAHINWDLIAVAFDDIFNSAKPKLNALFKQYLESEKTVQNYNLYVEVSAMQKLVGEDAQKQRMTEIYNDLIEPADSSVSDDTKKKLTESKARTSAWTDENGEFIGSGVDDNGKSVEDNPWYEAKEEMKKTLMKGIVGFKKTKEFKEWVKTSNEYSFRYNEDFQSTVHQKETDDAKMSINNEMSEGEYANDFDAELKLAFVRGYKAGLDAEKEKKLDSNSLLRRKYRY